ncbi:glycosyltransferase [Arthrobacter sp. R4-81]
MMKQIAKPPSKHPLRITLVLKTNEGGLWILPHVQEMLLRGHSVSVIVPPGDGRLTRSLRETNVRIVPSRFEFKFSPRPSTFWGLLRLRDQIKETSPDVLHYHLYASALATRLAAIGLGIPSVHMVAGPLYLDSGIIRFAERFLVTRDTKLIAGSRNTADRYLALGLQPSNLDVVPYGVDVETFRLPTFQEKLAARDELNFSQDLFVAVIVAYVYGPKRLVHVHSGIKGHDILLSAWKRFAINKKDVKLLLVGNGFDREGELHRQQLIGRYVTGSTDVRWIENVEDVRPYYWASNVSVSPSLSENHGAALEAGASGVARIVSDAGGLPETTDQASGWVVPRGDEEALFQALEQAYSEHRAGALEGKGIISRQQTAQYFDAKTSATRIVDVLESVIRTRRALRAVTLVSEARLGMDKAGQVAALDAASAAAAWERYSFRINDFRLAARTSPIHGSGRVSLGSVELERLPYYVGLVQLLRTTPALVFRLWKVVHGSRVLIARLPGPLGFITIILARILSKPVFVEVVGDPETVIRHHSSRPVRAFAKTAGFLMRYCVRTADGTRFVTHKTLQSLYPPRPDTPSLNMSNVQLHDDDFCSTYMPRSAHSWTLTCIGTQETNYKGHDIALEALTFLRDRGYDCTMVLIGNGALHSDLLHLARKLKVTNSVTFVDSYSSKSELWKFLDATDVFLHPSRSEGLPRVVLEAMARSRPVIATTVGGLPELLNGRHLVQPGNAQMLAECIQRMLDNPQEAETAARSNYVVARRYHYEELEKVFDEWCDIVSHRAQQQSHVDHVS